MASLLKDSSFICLPKLKESRGGLLVPPRLVVKACMRKGIVRSSGENNNGNPPNSLIGQSFLIFALRLRSKLVVFNGRQDLRICLWLDQ